ncbi:WD repeat-containing and planar cell polarity effector protein fritz homolog isoform X3 [Nematostella vectensis]|uniref:WD repeat-containing and planar cell polarity effector protein fritz homolog isoform X3 n=1 Tax=Nematostella vectensis TaxID=45351 RepID=UPI002077118F|nr:WD repeat-containing and planar cell polarity effector protein fritz homolog isoform X3 [Nematostella vectensis]
MASLLGQVHFWTLKKLAPGVGIDIGSHCYHDKSSGNEDKLAQLKRQWAEERGIAWTPRNKRPDRLRDNLKECEECLQNYSVICTRWRTLRNFQLLLSNGTLLSFLVSQNSGDLEKVLIDKSLVGKIPDHVCHAVLTDSFVIFSFKDKAKLFFVSLGKKPSLDFKKLERLSALDPKMSFAELPGPPNKKIDRRLSVNQRQEMVLVWWATQNEEAWPWSPLTGERDRSNIIIFGISGSKLEILCYCRTECDPVHVAFSFNQPHHVHTVEQSLPGSDDSSIDNCIYEYTKNKIERVTVTTIPINAPVAVQARNHAEDKLLLGCQDGTLMLYDGHRKITQMTKAAVTPHHIRWHPADAIILVCSARGEIQVFDMALAPVMIQLLSENPQPQSVLNLHTYFPDTIKLDKVSWSCEAPVSNITESSVGCHDNLVIIIDRGPLCLLRVELGVMSHGKLGCVELTSEYIKHSQGEEAVNFLNSMNWNTEGNTCFACMSLIMNYLLKLPLNPIREGLLEETLGSFYAPSRPLSDVTVLQYRDPISRLSRRFFHHLLRYKRFEKAFLLAVDIGAKDLFMDIHYLAADVGNCALAGVAKQRAIQIDSEPTSDTGESCDEESYEEDYPPEDEDGLAPSGTQHDLDYSLPHDHAPSQHQGRGPASHSTPVRSNAKGSGGPSHQASSDPNTPTGSTGTPGGALKIVHFGVV